MGQRLILTEQEKKNIQEMYGLINEQTRTGCIDGNCVDGRGTYVWNDGDKYVGEFVDNKRNGSGTFTWANGDSYVGEWVDGLANGSGTYTWESGHSYVGEWVDGKKNGEGTFICANGTEFKQTWKEGVQTSGNDFTFSMGEDCSGSSGTSGSSGSSGESDNYPLPENWKDGIMNSKWVIMKGSHSQDKKYPGAKKAIKFVQSKVGTKVDGLFGSNTESAVKKYQKDNNLTVDGIVGKNTLSKMLT